MENFEITNGVLTITSEQIKSSMFGRYRVLGCYSCGLVDEEPMEADAWEYTCPACGADSYGTAEEYMLRGIPAPLPEPIPAKYIIQDEDGDYKYRTENSTETETIGETARRICLDVIEVYPAEMVERTEGEIYESEGQLNSYEYETKVSDSVAIALNQILDRGLLELGEYDKAERLLKGALQALSKLI